MDLSVARYRVEGEDGLYDILEAAGEQFMIKSQLTEDTMNRTWVMVLSDKALYKMAPGAPYGDWKRKPLTDFHSVEEAADVHPCSFTTFMYKSSTKLNFSKAKGFLGLGMDFSSFLQRRHYTCRTVAERSEWVFVLNRLVQSIWQREFERLVVPSGEYYQRHSYVIKVNRKRKAQDRLLLITDMFLYNVEVSHNPTAIKGWKWALPIEGLERITLLDDTRMVMKFRADMKIDDVHMGEKGTDVHEQQEFAFRSAQERQHVLADLARLFLDLTGASRGALPITSSMGPEHPPTLVKDFDFGTDDASQDPETLSGDRDTSEWDDAAVSVRAPARSVVAYEASDDE